MGTVGKRASGLRRGAGPIDFLNPLQSRGNSSRDCNWDPSTYWEGNVLAPSWIRNLWGETKREQLLADLTSGNVDQLYSRDASP